MTDPFLLLGFERRPYLDGKLLDQKLRKLAAIAHPDRSGDTAVFQELHSATTLLRSPALRLRLLAGSLEEKSKILPPEAVHLFSKIASCLNNADTLIASYQKAQGALAKALLMAPLKASQLELDSLYYAICNWKDSLENNLQQLDAAWPAVTVSELLTLADSFAFATRWEEQISERKFVLKTIG
ncbi:MAG: hypothetical protein ACH346_08525 [Chthoniobacterales bacterium]